MSEQTIVDALGAFPIIQIAVAGAIAVGAVLAWYRGERRKDPTAGGLPPGASWFFDGPIVKALESLQGCYRTLQEIRQDNQRHADEQRRREEEQSELIRELLKLRRGGR